MTDSTTFRPRSARVTAVAVLVLAAGGALAHALAEGPRAAAPTLGLATLACVVAVTAYWRPCVRVSDDTVEVVNVLSTVTIPLARVVHVDTRWALEIELDTGRKVSAFAAPAPGTYRARNFRVEDLRGLPADTYAHGSVRVGDSPGTASGDAALIVRTALGTWRASKIVDTATVTRRPHVASAVALVLGLAAAIAGFVL